MGRPAISSFACEPPTAARFFPGETLVYQLKYASASTSDFSVLLGKPAATQQQRSSSAVLASSFDSKVSGTLRVTVLDRNGQSVLAAYRLGNAAVSFKIGGQEATAEAQRISSGLSRHVFVHMTGEGRIVSAWLDPPMGILPHAFARTLLAVTQFVFPPAESRGGLKWEVEEDDTNGPHLVRYEVAGSSRDRATGSVITAIRKTKVQYRKPPSETRSLQAELPTRILASGDLIGRFDCQAGRLLSLEGSETNVVEIADKVVSRTEMTLRLELSHVQKMDQPALASMRQAGVERKRVVAAVPLWWREPEEVSDAALQRKILGTATAEELLAELRRDESAGRKPPGSVQLFSKLKALVYLQPNVSEGLAGMLQEAPARSLTMSMLSGALGAAGHSEAQVALVSAVRNRREDPVALALLLPALAAAPSPTESAEEILRGLTFHASNAEIAHGAQLALGRMARHLQPRSPERAARIVDLLVRQLEGAGPAPARQLLLALGNAGSPRTLPVLRRFLGHSLPLLRGAAVGSLRFIEGDEADSLLAQVLAGDSEADVRSQAAQALSYRPMTPRTFVAQKQALHEEKEEPVRLVLLENLWWARQKFPEARELLQAAATGETSPEVRRKAAWLLASER